eukprot:766451-Prymnesium_polylepis.1
MPAPRHVESRLKIVERRLALGGATLSGRILSTCEVLLSIVRASDGLDWILEGSIEAERSVGVSSRARSRVVPLVRPLEKEAPAGAAEASDPLGWQIAKGILYDTRLHVATWPLVVQVNALIKFPGRYRTPGTLVSSPPGRPGHRCSAPAVTSHDPRARTTATYSTRRGRLIDVP